MEIIISLQQTKEKQSRHKFSNFMKFLVQIRIITEKAKDEI